ncbi:acyltransferase [Helicobacter rodentium]|uniref:acyltransferase n=1 Tax=Helicobacter rodentium TaxID=59617 RepID=UPI000690841E|nr:acyltransferase [Helicobacter rodentium]
MQTTIREKQNIIYGDLNQQRNHKIEFLGSNNILYFAGASQNTQIIFRGNNGLVFIGNNTRVTGKIEIATNGVCYIGDDSTFNGVGFRVFEGKNIVVGNDCMFSWSIWLGTCDHHLIFDSQSFQRVNFSKSIYIGDHVWCGQESAILKGAFIPSGSIIGAKSIVSGIKESNAIYAGNPAQCLKKHKFWLRDDPSAGNWTKEQTALHSQKETNDFQYIYQKEKFLSPKALETKLESLENASEKLEFLYDFVYCNRSKNRFAYFVDSKINIPLPITPKLFYKTTLANPDTDSNAQENLPIGAKHRIHNHLAYKLGSAMILNSKSFLGYIRIPYVLSYIKEAHKKEIADYEAKVAKNPKLKLPKLESYADYKEALREKECFTYKLGEALMKASRDWVKGGYLRFFFQEISKLRRGLKEKRK